MMLEKRAFGGEDPVKMFGPLQEQVRGWSWNRSTQQNRKFMMWFAQVEMGFPLYDPMQTGSLESAHRYLLGMTEEYLEEMWAKFRLEVDSE